MPLWVSEAAQGFWSRAGFASAAPHDLRRAVLWALPIDVVEIPQLSVGRVREWLSAQGVQDDVVDARVRDRLLRACVVARSACGLLMIDQGDAESEQRFSLAHELAHFLRHYIHRRDQAVKQLGPGILQVLDGFRPPTTEERVHAVLARFRLGAHVHLMERTATGHSTSVISHAEREADLLAFELLAPSAEILDAVSGVRAVHQRSRITELLTTRWGLPEGPATDYASMLTPERPEGLWDERLRALQRS